MYNDFYALSFNPFDKSISEKDSYLSRDFQEMTHRLNYLKDTRGIGVFTARPGMGKSYCLRCFGSIIFFVGLPPRNVLICYATLDRMEKQCCSFITDGEELKNS